MAEQITLFPTVIDADLNELEIVEMKFVESRYLTVEELFQGFNHLYAITFSYGLDFISKIIDYFDTAEIIIGCEAMVKYDLKLISSFQTRALEEVREHKYLIERVKNDTLSFRIAKDMLSHQKLYILVSDSGNTRIIWGSANFSGRPFSGNQRENIGFFENDLNAFNFYMDEYNLLRSLSTNEVVKEALFFTAETLEEKFDNLPIIREIKTNKAGIILEHNPENDAAIEFAYDVNSLAKKYEKFIPKFDKKSHKTLVTPSKIQEMKKMIKEVEQEEKAKRSQFPHFNINYYEGTFNFEGRPYDFNIEMDAVRQDLIHIGEYFDGFNAFIGEVDQLKKSYYRLMNYMFLSPFLAKLRYETDKSDFSKIVFPIYVVVNGIKNAGKSAFVETMQKAMYGQKIGSVDPNTFNQTNAYGYMREAAGVPLHIEDINRDRFNRYCGTVVKYDEYLIKEKLLNHPVFIFTANDIESIKKEYAKRVYYISLDAQLTDVMAASMHKKMTEIRKKITTSFYREYLKRMYDKVMNLIDEMHNFVLMEDNENWTPDVFILSSQTILEIYRDCGVEPPDFFDEFTYSECFGSNMLSEKVREKIIFEWKHNKKAFKVMRKKDILEFVAGERSYEATRICEALPEVLRAKCSRNKVIMNLTEAEKFFGIYFKNTFF